MQTYIVDSYTRYAASGVAAAVVLRSLAGFGFPLFAPYLYSSLGYGWGNSLLGFLAIGIGGKFGRQHLNDGLLTFSQFRHHTCSGFMVRG
jgi:hypothetical protein